MAARSRCWRRLGYLGRMARHRLLRRHGTCPNCGGAGSEVLARKHVVTELRRCEDCLLLFRDPTDPPGAAERLYDTSYRSGLTTDMPDEPALAEMKRTGFSGTSKCYGRHVALLRALGLGPGARLFDYGCSWGYGTWQLQAAGFRCWAAEISRERARYAVSRLGLRVLAGPEAVRAHPELEGSFDCFFAAHVLEHLSAPGRAIELADWLLTEGGMLVAFVPNGCADARRAHPSWHRWWGEVHPSFIDDTFLERVLAGWPRILGSPPLCRDALHRLRVQDAGTIRLPRSGAELAFIAKKRGTGSRSERVGCA